MNLYPLALVAISLSVTTWLAVIVLLFMRRRAAAARISIFATLFSAMVAYAVTRDNFAMDTCAYQGGMYNPATRSCLRAMR